MNVGPSIYCHYEKTFVVRDSLWLSLGGAGPQVVGPVVWGHGATPHSLVRGCGRGDYLGHAAGRKNGRGRGGS